MIAIVDYGVGNLFSLASSVRSLGAEVCVTGRAADLRAASHILLPGVGAFADAMGKLRATGLVPVLQAEAAHTPLLGICLGMQLLFDKSHEYGEHAGLGLIPGEVCPLAADLRDQALKVPHIGWNALDIAPGRADDPLFRYVKNGEYVYYVHSYYAKHPVLQAGDPELALARLALLRSVGQVVKNGLELLGVSAPESM